MSHIDPTHEPENELPEDAQDKMESGMLPEEQEIELIKLQEFEEKEQE